MALSCHIRDSGGRCLFRRNGLADIVVRQETLAPSCLVHSRVPLLWTRTSSISALCPYQFKLPMEGPVDGLGVVAEQNGVVRWAERLESYHISFTVTLLTPQLFAVDGHITAISRHHGHQYQHDRDPDDNAQHGQKGMVLFLRDGIQGHAESVHGALPSEQASYPEDCRGQCGRP